MAFISLVISVVFLKKSSSMPQTLATSASDGCTTPLSSVQRDISMASPPSQFHGSVKRVCALRLIGSCLFASCQVLPPLVETSTQRTVPPPDHASPLIS